MNSKSLNKWLSLVTNLGVLIGVFLVAYELRQNSVTMQAQTRSEITAQNLDSVAMSLDNPHVLEALEKESRNEQLTPIEERILNTITRSRFRRWENIHYQYRRGLYSNEEFAGQLNVWERSVAANRNQEFWIRNREDFSVDFAELIDRFIE